MFTQTTISQNSLLSPLCKVSKSHVFEVTFVSRKAWLPPTTFSLGFQSLFGLLAFVLNREHEENKPACAALRKHAAVSIVSLWEWLMIMPLHSSHTKWEEAQYFLKVAVCGEGYLNSAGFQNRAAGLCYVLSVGTGTCWSPDGVGMDPTISNFSHQEPPQKICLSNYHVRPVFGLRNVFENICECLFREFSQLQCLVQSFSVWIKPNVKVKATGRGSDQTSAHGLSPDHDFIRF